MSISTTFDFTNPNNYTLSNISILDNIASLSLVALSGLSFSQPLTSSFGFTFNSSNTSISAGLLSQINQLVTATFTDLINVSVGTGSITKTSGGTAFDAGAISNQTLTGDGLIQFVSNTNTQGEITGLAMVNPNGSAVSDMLFAFNISGTNYTIYEAGANKTSPVAFSSGTVFKIQITSNVVNYYVNSVLVYTSLTAATYPMFFATIMYYVGENITGIQIQNGATQYLGDSIIFPAFNYSGLGNIVAWNGFTSGGDINSPGYILNGLYWNGMAWVSSNGSYGQSNSLSVVNANIDDLPNNNTLVIKVVTASGSVPMSIAGPVGVSYSGQNYSNGTIQTNTGVNAEDLMSFASTFSQSGSDSVTFALLVNSVLMYWNGSAWTSSNGSLPQTNSASVISANCASLLNVNSTVGIYVLLTSGAGTTTPNITNMTIVYDFGQISPGAPKTTLIYGFLSDIQGNPVVGASITFSLVNIIPNAYMEGADNILIAGSVTATTNSQGYFQQAVIATTQFQGTNTFIAVTITKGSVVQNVGPNGEPLYLSIPIQQSIDITTLLSA